MGCEKRAGQGSVNLGSIHYITYDPTRPTNRSPVHDLFTLPCCWLPNIFVLFGMPLAEPDGLIGKLGEPGEDSVDRESYGKILTLGKDGSDMTMLYVVALDQPWSLRGPRGYSSAGFRYVHRRCAINFSIRVSYVIRRALQTRPSSAGLWILGIDQLHVLRCVYVHHVRIRLHYTIHNVKRVCGDVYKSLRRG